VLARHLMAQARTPEVSSEWSPVPLHRLRQLDQGLRNPPWVKFSGSHVADRPALSCSIAMSFVRQHADQMLACDFFLVDTVWLTQLYVFFFIEIGSRCVHLAGWTNKPDCPMGGAASPQPGLPAPGRHPLSSLLNRDSKFTAAFDGVFRTEGVRIVRLPVRAPRARTPSPRGSSAQHGGSAWINP